MVIKNHPLIECRCGSLYPDPRDSKDSYKKHINSKIHSKNLCVVMLYSQACLNNGSAKVGDPIPDKYIMNYTYPKKKGEL